MVMGKLIVGACFSGSYYALRANSQRSKLSYRILRSTLSGYHPVESADGPRTARCSRGSLGSMWQLWVVVVSQVPDSD